jgi:hypothetical protein
MWSPAHAAAVVQRVRLMKAITETGAVLLRGANPSIARSHG